MLISNFANNQQEMVKPDVNKQQDTEPDVEEQDAEVIQNTIR